MTPSTRSSSSRHGQTDHPVHYDTFHPFFKQSAWLYCSACQAQKQTSCGTLSTETKRGGGGGGGGGAGKRCATRIGKSHTLGTASWAGWCSPSMTLPQDACFAHTLTLHYINTDRQLDCYLTIRIYFIHRSGKLKLSFDLIH